MSIYAWTYNLIGNPLGLAALPAWLPYMLCRRKYRCSLARRAGWLPARDQARLRPGQSIWVHAVSVGEFNLAATLIEQLRPHCPDMQFVVSVTTMTGYEVAQRRLTPADVLMYFPLEFWPVMDRMVARVRPRAAVIVETEIWPNFLYALGRRGIPCVLANGRISQKSFDRYRLARPFMRDVLGRFAQCNMQTGHDAARLRALGAPPARVAVAGNIKFDAARLVDMPAPDATLRAELGLPTNVPVFLAAALDKTGEEDALMIDVLEQVRAQAPQTALIIVPRHPERGPELARLVAQRGYVPRQRSQGAQFADPAREIFIVDTIGELKRFYTIAQAVFVGKSLCAPGGGQNMIEPIALGVPTMYGPHTANFRGVADVLLEHGGARLVRSTGELAAAILDVGRDPAAACAMVQRGQAFIRSQHGATQRTVASILAALHPNTLPHRG